MTIINVTAAPYNAVGDDSTNNTTALQNAINAAETAPRGGIYIPAGTYRHTGLTITKGISISGDGWATILKNTSNTNHSISKATGLQALSERLKIQDLALDHTGGGSSVDGIHLDEIANHTFIDSVKIDNAPRDGIAITGIVSASRSSLYCMIQQCYIEGALRHGVYLNGSVNNLSMIGGRIGSCGLNNSGYGLKTDDTLTGSSYSYPNTVRMLGTDFAGNEKAIYDGGHSNLYVGCRFEGNVSGEIVFASKSQNAFFIGSAFSDNKRITGTPSARAVMFDKAHFLRFFQDNGVLEYYDELTGGVRKLPKRGYFTFTLPATPAGSGTIDWPINRVQDTIKITRVSFIPNGNVTAHATNYCRLCLRVKKIAGGDSAIATKSFSSGNWTALTDNSQTVDTNQDDRVDGDILYIEKDEYGSGLATPITSVQIEYEG